MGVPYSQKTSGPRPNLISVNPIQGKTILITGGASGIGYRTGRAFLEAGAGGLVIWDIDGSALENRSEELRGEGYRVWPFRVDLADPAQVDEAMGNMRREELEIDILVNNAGIVVGKEFRDHSSEEIDRTMEVNALAPMQISRRILPGMIQRGGGQIVNVASAAGMMSNPRMSVYCASKWSVIGWSEALRIEMERGNTGVRVLTVTPYYVDTGMFLGVRSPWIPIVKAESLARQIVKAVRKGKIFLRSPRILNLLPLLRGLLPKRWFDRIVGDWLGIYRSMDHFEGRKDG